MSDTNLFSQAINSRETNAFFKGECRYFLRNRENGEHAFLSHMTGWVVSYVESDPQNTFHFDNAFIAYLASLSLTDQDFHSLQMNLIAYQRLKERNLLDRSKLFDTGSTKAAALTEHFLFKYLQMNPSSRRLKNAIDYWSVSKNSILSMIFKRIEVKSK